MYLGLYTVNGGTKAMAKKNKKPGNVTGRPKMSPTCAKGKCEYPDVCPSIQGCAIEVNRSKGKKVKSPY
tara:strand:+ start:464 stop:670 length:207 start_codon:yes stop_codon:yes gene_type:complete